MKKSIKLKCVLFRTKILRKSSELIILAKSLLMWSNDGFENLSLVIEFLSHVFIYPNTESDLSHEAELTGIVSATFIAYTNLEKLFC